MDAGLRASERVKAADAEAAEAQSAFITGTFDEYWKRKADEAKSRMEVSLAKYTKGRGTEDSTTGSGTNDGGASDSDGGLSPSNA